MLNLYNPFVIRIYQIVPEIREIIDKAIPKIGIYIPNPIIDVNIPLWPVNLLNALLFIRIIDITKVAIEINI